MRVFPGPVALLLAAMLVPACTGAVSAEAGIRTRTVHRAYGDGPVRLADARTVKIQFDGRRGDRVRLDGAGGCPVSLRGPAGADLSKQRTGFWRLAHHGVQTFRLTRCAALTDDSLVQLEKLHVSRAATNGPGLRLRSKRGYVAAVRVRVPASGRLQVKGRDLSGHVRLSFDAMLLPDGTRYQLGGLGPLNDPYFFEPGRKIYGRYGPLRGAGGDRALLMRAGEEVLVLLSGSGTVWQSVATEVATTIDGPATTLPPSDVPYREYRLEFPGQAGSWLSAEVVGPTGEPSDQTFLIGPNGHQFERSRFWLLPATGTYQLMVPTAPTTRSTQVRMRSVEQVSTPVPTDGTHIVLATDDPGRWVVAPMSLDFSGYRLSAHSAVASGGWTVMATVRNELHCPRVGQSGCGGSSSGIVGPTMTTSPGFGGYGPDWVVLLRPDPGVTASVELSVSPDA